MKPSKLFIIIFILLFAFFTIFFSYLIFIKNKTPEGSVKILKRANDEYYPGHIEIGGKMPWGIGEMTFAPILEIPDKQKFYINVAQPDLWCSNESCGIDGAIIQTMGGWIEIEPTEQSEVQSTFGLDSKENNKIKSVVIVGDKNNKVHGIYLNKTYSDVLSILKQNHSDLADFGKLPGVQEFEKLKVGEFAPLKPGDNILNLFSKNAINPISQIPKDKKFYLFSLEKKSDYIPGVYNHKEFNMGEFKRGYVCFLGSCRYPYPDNPHDFLFADIEDLGGWFLANDNDNIKMVELFGLNSEEVLSAKTSLVILTDSHGKIVALHPGKTLNDAITILSQRPELVDIRKFYP